MTSVFKKDKTVCKKMSTNLKIFITLFIAIFVTTMGAGIVVPLLPLYAHELGGTAFQVGLLFAAFSLTRTLFVPYFGKLSDLKGKKLFLTGGLICYFIFSVLYVFSRDIQTIILLRLGHGFASAMILPVAQAYVGELTPPRQEGKIMGIFNISLYGGLSVGPILGGIINDQYNIHVAFLIMGILSLVAFFLCLFLLPKEIPSTKHEKKTIRDSSSYLQMLRNREIFSLFIYRACYTICIGITWIFIPLLAGSKLGLSASAIGIIVMINVLVSGILQAPMGSLADRFNKKILVATGGILAIIAMMYLYKADSFRELLFANGLLGVGGGVAIPAIMALGVIQGHKTKAMGSLMGLLSQGHSIGMLAGPLLAGLCIDFFSFGATFLAGAMILGIGTLIFLFCYKL